MSLDPQQLRARFPLLGRIGRGGRPIAYLDSSATSQKPDSVIEAEADFYRYSNGAVNRGTHLLADEATTVYEEGRAALAKFVGARVEEISWTKNSTEALNLVAYALLVGSLRGDGPVTIGHGDRIVVTRAEHHANLLPWQLLADRLGAELRWIDLTPTGLLDLDTLGVITANTKVVAFTHMSNVTGAISPLAQIRDAARDVGALVVLDTCQSAAHMPLDVHRLGVDVACFSAHKMCGPTGIGAVYIRAEVGQKLPPFMVGGSMIRDVDMGEVSYQDPPLRFEAGTQPVAQIAGWKAAIDFLTQIGMDNVVRHEQQITARLLDGLSQVTRLRLLGPKGTENRLGVASFTLGDIHPHDVGQILDSADIAVRVGHHCALPLHKFFGVRASVRASVCLTTTVEEIDRLVEGLDRAISFFAR